MVLEDNEDALFKEYTNLCNRLNLDSKTISSAWQSYQAIQRNYSLEGEQLEWLGCAIFVACRFQDTVTVNQSVVKGNCVSLTSLLRQFDLSFGSFFLKIEEWCEMAKLSADIKNKIRDLRETFCVTCNTFKEFYPYFEKIFLIPSDPSDLDQIKTHRTRKNRQFVCNNAKVFEFIWLLFINLKADESEYSTDLIKAFHLLYCCMDLVFKNAFLNDRRDLLNEHFEGLPEDWTNPAYQVPEDAPCLIDHICKDLSTLTDAKHMKLYTFRDLIRNLMKNGVLAGNPDNLTDMLTYNNFDTNYRNITKAYEAKLLNKGDFDERIFISEYRRTLMEREHLKSQSIIPGCLDVMGTESPRPTAPATPLTAKHYLSARDADGAIIHTDDKSKAERITRLHNLMQGRSAEPSAMLLQLFEICSEDPTDRIEKVLKEVGDTFLAEYPLNNSPKPDEVENRLNYGKTLFYKFTENILQREKNIHNDISSLVQKDIFYKCTLACCLEIVNFCLNGPRKFPWILNVLDIQAYHFVKVIELIIRAKEPLSRDMIKHLNKIEETIIESLAWTSKSLLWEEIKNSGQEIPKFEDIALPGHLFNVGKSQNSQNNENILQSPGPSAMDRFQSPVKQTNATHQLFKTVQAGQSVLQKHLMVTSQDGTKKLIPLIETDKVKMENAENSIAPPVNDKLPKRTGSLSIIFRKFYNLAGVRMENLCSKLGITDTNLKLKIWTLFEDSVRHTNLIKDRHLDQLLMCAVYVICKICDRPITFTNIMKYYRDQPQATSNVYRDVLLKPARTKIVDGEERTIPEERGDLIYFYNSVYVNVIKSSLNKFQSTSEDSNLILSPMPSGKKHFVSPTVRVFDNVFIKPLEISSAASPVPSHTYIFSRSPSKELKNINKSICNNGVNGKRLLIDGEMNMPSTKRFANKKLDALVKERQSQVSE